MTNVLRELPVRQANGRRQGIYSVCSAHPLVIEAAAMQALEDGTPLLVEATSNQVDQFGGYTGMRPDDFREFVWGVGGGVGLAPDRVVLGGDHLGPNPWRNRTAEAAMQLAEELIAAYARAGFTKLHLDTSMACADDPPRLTDDVVAARAAKLCAVAEREAGGRLISYVVGTEVPVPGGAAETLQTVDVTRKADAQATLDIHRSAFEHAGLHEAWKRVIALVVQPGVEFDHTAVVDYQPDAATELSTLLEENRGIVFEAHSTDYQRPEMLERLVADGFAVLKVGPGLTFALREALFALSEMESVLVEFDQRANLPLVVEAAMQASPENWNRYYHGDPAHQAMLRIYSYSDRIRYYWAINSVGAAVDRLFKNLSAVGIPGNVLSQHMPLQYDAWRQGELACEPKALAIHAIREVLRPYAIACKN